MKTGNNVKADSKYREVVPDRLTALARTFHTLRNADGIDPFDPDTLEVWASNRSLSSGTREAAKYVLWRYDPDRVWKCGRFNAKEGSYVWDLEQIEAYKAAEKKRHEEWEYA